MNATERHGLMYWQSRSWQDWLYALALLFGVGYAQQRYSAYMDGYEQIILLLAAPTCIALGWSWSALQRLFAGSAVLALFSISLYTQELARADRVFLLKYLISSQSAILWMCALYFAATLVYWAGLLMRSAFALATATGLTWAATVFGLVGLLVRWYESYLIGTDVGHIPISNLYEVFVLFALITALLYLYIEARYATRLMGAFVLLVISAAIGFLLWYTFSREAHAIQPLVPALQSWWMKIHVPANFIGYGAFALAAMVASAHLLASRGVLDELRIDAFAGQQVGHGQIGHGDDAFAHLVGAPGSPVVLSGFLLRDYTTLVTIILGFIVIITFIIVIVVLFCFQIQHVTYIMISFSQLFNVIFGKIQSSQRSYKMFSSSFSVSSWNVFH